MNFKTLCFCIGFGFVLAACEKKVPIHEAAPQAAGNSEGSKTSTIGAESASRFSLSLELNGSPQAKQRPSPQKQRSAPSKQRSAPSKQRSAPSKQRSTPPKQLAALPVDRQDFDQSLGKTALKETGRRLPQETLKEMNSECIRSSILQTMPPSYCSCDIGEFSEMECRLSSSVQAAN